MDGSQPSAGFIYLKCFFINKPDSPYFESELFRRILEYLQTHTNKARLKQSGKNFLLVIEEMRDMKTMLQFLQKMHKQVIAAELVTTSS